MCFAEPGTCILIRVLDERYNCKPWVEFMQIAHMGQRGEMHVSGHTPVKP